METSEQRSWGFYILPLVKDFPFNPVHQIVRIVYKGKNLDLRVAEGSIIPNFQDHLMLVTAPDRVMENEEVSEDRLMLLPGLADSDGTLATIPQGFCFPVHKRQRVYTSNPQSAFASFAISDTNMFDLDNVVTAVSPQFADRDYTTVDKSGTDPNIGSIGIFINKQGTILIKSTGGSITIGKEGTQIGGQLHTESSSVNTGALADNTFADIIPSTVVTVPVAFPKFLNYSTFANLANAGMKFVEVASKTKAVSSFVSALKRTL